METRHAQYITKSKEYARGKGLHLIVVFSPTYHGAFLRDMKRWLMV